MLPLSRDSPALAQLGAHLDHQDFWRHCLLLVAGLRCGQPWESPSAALAPQVVLLHIHQLQSSEEQDSLEVMPLPRDSPALALLGAHLDHHDLRMLLLLAV